MTGTNDDSSTRDHATFSFAHGAGGADHFKQLFDDVEELIGRLADTDSSEIEKLRAKVRVATVVARGALIDAADLLQNQAQQVAKRADKHLREKPWQTVWLVACLGVATGMLLGRRR